MRVARARERTGVLIMTAGFAVMAIGMVAGPAMADPHSGIDSQLYRPAVDPAGVFSVDGGATLPRYDLSLQLGVGYGHRPLRLIVPGIGDSGADAIIEFALAMHLTVGFGLSDRLSLVLDTGLYRTATGDGYGSRGRYRSTGPEPSTGIISLRPVSNIDPSGGFEAQGLSGPLDVRAGFKLGIIDGSALHVALLALASLPFGEDEMFLGDAGFVLSPKLALDYDFNADGTTKLAVNLGANLRRRTVLQAYNPHDPVAASPDDALAVLDVGSELTAGVGFTYELGKRLVGGAETMLLLPLPARLSMGSCSLYDGSRCASLDAAGYAEGAGYGDPTGYAVAGIRFRAGADVTLSASVGAGFLGARRDDARMMAGIIWTPVPTGMQPMGAGDRDGDGMLDVADLCPDEREDVDGYQDEDGCVDIDNDGDGIPDARDVCPDDPEDKDGHLDTDGCPERDNDSDSIPDIKDRCPDAAEDADGFEDDDGCPDEDNDGDGILDGVDSCPNEPEVVNGIDDKDGCPDSRTQTGPAEDVDRINLRGNEIEFAGARSARLTEASEEVLEQIAELIKRRNLKVRVEVHVPSSTRSLRSRAQSRARRSDKALAQRRADAIIDYLAKRQSVPLPLLQAVGIGSDRPVKKPATDPQNGRVDFIKIEQKQP